MFHISFLIRDKNLAEALHLLQGKVMNLQVLPAKAEPVQSLLDTPLRESGRKKSARAKKQVRRKPIIGVIDSMPEEFGVKDLAELGYGNPSIYTVAKKLIDEGRLIKAAPGRWRKISPLAERQVG